MLLNGVLLLAAPLKLLFLRLWSFQRLESSVDVPVERHEEVQGHQNHGGERHKDSLIEKTPKGYHERKISEDGSYRIPSTRANDGEQEKREGQRRYRYRATPGMMMR